MFNSDKTSGCQPGISEPLSDPSSDSMRQTRGSGRQTSGDFLFKCDFLGRYNNSHHSHVNTDCQGVTGRDEGRSYFRLAAEHRLALYTPTPIQSTARELGIAKSAWYTQGESGEFSWLIGAAAARLPELELWYWSASQLVVRGSGRLVTQRMVISSG